MTTKPNIYRAGLKYKNADWLFTLNANAVTGQSEKNFVDSSYFTLDLGAHIRLTIMLSCSSMATILPMHAMPNLAACTKTAKQNTRWQDVPSSSAQNTPSNIITV